MNADLDHLVDDEYCSVPEAAALLGIGTTLMRELLVTGKIPYITPSKHKRVLVTDLLNYKRKRTKKGVATRLPHYENLLAD